MLTKLAICIPDCNCLGPINDLYFAAYVQFLFRSQRCYLNYDIKEIANQSLIVIKSITQSIGFLELSRII